jgi:hypothetical protein
MGGYVPLSYYAIKSGKLGLPALSAPLSFITATFSSTSTPLRTSYLIITPLSDTVALEQFNARHHNQSPY